MDTHIDTTTNYKTRLAGLSWELNTTRTRVLTALEALRGAKDMLEHLEGSVQELADEMGREEPYKPKQLVLAGDDGYRMEMTPYQLADVLTEWFPEIRPENRSWGAIIEFHVARTENSLNKPFPSPLYHGHGSQDSPAGWYWDVDAVIDWYRDFPAA